MDRIPFWKVIQSRGLLSEKGLIIGGDLNFTLSASETWGSARLDPEADFFFDLISGEGLQDVEPTILSPTWHNGRRGEACIGKFLDRFLVDSDYLA